MKKNLFHIFLLAFILTQFVISARADVKAEKIVKQVLTKYEAAKTFQADFEQTYYWVLTDNKSEQYGTIWLEGKTKFKIQTENQLIVSDGKTVWTYSKTTNQVLIDDVQKTDDITLPGDIMLTFLDKYDPVYIGEELTNGIKCHRLELTSKTDDQFIQKIILWIGNKDLEVKKIQQIDLNKNKNTYVLKSIQFDVLFPKDFFQYSPPDSVEIIDMR